MEVSAREEGSVTDLVLDRKTFFLIAGCTEKIKQREPLAISVAIDCRLVSNNRRRCNRARCVSNLLAQIRAFQVFTNALKRDEVKRFVLFEWTADSGAKLLAMKIGQWLAV